jgi:hypothetical protein
LSEAGAAAASPAGGLWHCSTAAVCREKHPWFCTSCGC